MTDERRSENFQRTMLAGGRRQSDPPIGIKRKRCFDREAWLSIALIVTAVAFVCWVGRLFEALDNDRKLIDAKVESKMGRP